MAVDLNTDLNYAQVQQANLASALSKIESAPSTSAQETRKTIFGNGPSVTVSHANGLDLSTIVDRLNAEGSDTNTTVAKHKIGNVFAILIARARESGLVSEANMTHFNNIEKWSQQLDKNATDLNNNQREINTIQKNIDKIENKIKVLDDAIENEKDPQKLEKLQQQRAAYDEQLSTLKSELENLNAMRVQLQNTKHDLEYKIDSSLAKIGDVALIRELVESLKIDASDVSNLMSEIDDKERGDDLEKYLDKHSPVRILQDAIAHHDEDLLNTIEEKRDIRA